MNVTVNENMREIVFFKNQINPKTKKKESIRIRRSFLDLTVTTMFDTGYVHREVFTAHVYPGRKTDTPEIRVAVPKNGVYDERQSLTVSAFVATHRRRFGEMTENIVGRIMLALGDDLEVSIARRQKAA